MSLIYSSLVVDGCKRVGLLTFDGSASSLGMMSEDEKRVQRIEDIKELLS